MKSAALSIRFARKQGDSLAVKKSRLSHWSKLTKFRPCRFTNFIATSVKRTAKSWCAPATGTERNARIVVQPKYPRNFPRSLRQPQVQQHHRRLHAAACRVPAACAGLASLIGTD